MREAVIVASKRTGLAKSYRGSFNATRPDEMASHVIKAALEQVPQLDAKEVEDVILGCGFPEGAQGMNVARIAALGAGMPESVAATTVNRFCSSGLQAIAMAAHQIREGADAAIGGGVESITMGQGKMNADGIVSGRVMEMWPGVYMGMGETAEVVADRYKISREDQDKFALRSQQRTAAAQQSGIFKDEIAPMATKFAKKGDDGNMVMVDTVVDKDECNRPSTTLEGLSSLPPSFRQDGGTVTAGNASQLSDGASATILMSTERAKALGIEPLGIYRGFAVAGCRPEEMGIGPVFAVPKLLERAGLKISDIDIVELNEAFASQLLYCMRTLGISDEQINPNGGSIAIGHPYGMTGSRMTGHVLYELRRRGGKYGIVTMCIGGGQGMAALFEAC
ncbi:MAG TPA: thiolase family protein [Candidatus Binatia bacterium]|nr:thiolase family protein [Candidatus Binatia bacterium]